MTVLDRLLVAAGRAYAAISRGGRSPARSRLVIAALVLFSLLPVIGIFLTSIPSETSFDDLRAGRYRGLGWLRLEGDLRPAGRADDGRYLYVLHDVANDEVAVTIYAPGPLPTGATQVTGQARTDVKLPGTFDTFYADAVTEPARHDPWPLIALPALIALFLIVGARAGYPVLRHEDRPRRASTPAQPLAAGERIAARWSGRLAGEERPLEASRPCTIEVSGDVDVYNVTVADEQGRFPLVVRRGSPKLLGRVCRIEGCAPSIELHAPGGDLLVEFSSLEDRARVAAVLS